VRAHSKTDVERRLDDAFYAVTGERKPSGNKAKSDDEAILLQMGEIYFLRRFGFTPGSMNVGDIAMEASEAVRGEQPFDSNSLDSIKRRLRKKFTANLDRWCYAAAERRGLPSTTKTPACARP
jgi:hypothetical protein